MESCTVKLQSNKYLDNTPFFAYLPQSEKTKIKRRVTMGTTIICAVLNSKEYHVFAFILDINKDELHIREVAGNFLRNIFALDVYSEAVAKVKEKKRLTCGTNRKAVRNMLLKLRFKENEFGQYFRNVG